MENAQLIFTASGLTSITSAAITLPAPDAPSTPTLQATVGDGEVTINWNQVSDATGYKVYMGTESRTYSAIETTPSMTDSYTFTGLTNGTTYYFAVTAFNGGGVSSYSNEVIATPQMPAPYYQWRR